MPEKPILFNTEMVQAILTGRKTQTRRTHKKPKYNIGDHLWAKETFQVTDYSDCLCSENDCCFCPSKEYVIYKADLCHSENGWKPSLFMSKKYARLWLEVVNVKTQRLQDITEKEATAEGISPNGCSELCKLNKAYLKPITCFAFLWDSINGKDKAKSWAANPFVWVYEFKVISK